MNVPLLAVNKAVKLDFFTGQDRDSTEGERKEEEERVVQLTDFLCQVHHKLRFITIQDVTTFTAATMAAEGRSWKGQFDIQEETNMQEL